MAQAVSQAGAGTALALFSLYGAIVLSCRLSHQGGQHLGADFRNYAALVLVVPGTVFLFAGAMWMVGETGASKTLVIEEIDNALETLKPKPPIAARGCQGAIAERPARPEAAIPPPYWPVT